MQAAKAIVKNRVLILIVALALMIPATLGMLGTRINYDMLNYLPDDMDTVIGQDTLKDDFGKGAFSFIIVEDMPEKDVAALKEKIEAVDHVDTVLWYDSLADLSVPMELLPDKLYSAFNQGNATMMAVFFDSATSEDVTMDIDGELDRPAIDGIERQANAAVRADLPVTARYPAPAELRGMTYRGKGPADGAVRIVTIGDVDACACCAPHVAHTGEIGAIKLLEAIRYKGGMRIHLQAGADATEEARLCFAQNAQIAAALSVRRGEAHDAVQRLLAERDALVRQLRAARREGALLHAAAAEIPVSGAACLILSPADDEAVRDAALALAARGARPCAVFSGSDGQGYAYVAAGGDELPVFARSLNAALNGRGGGKGPLMRGRVNAAADRIRAFCAGFGV